MNNIEEFNNYAGRLLVDLYEQFPIHVRIKAETYIGRCIDLGPEPYEDEAIESEIDAWKKASKLREEYLHKKNLLIATVQFLYNERFIIFYQERPNLIDTKKADQVLIREALQDGRYSLPFSLTAYGLAQLSRAFTGGKMQKDTLIGKLKAAIGDEVARVPTAALGALVPQLFIN